ncbi:MAG: porin [Candidatus Eremiobacteraeota bacterium]|nr:porin [Candidatus Eremiobacteraeota bacterium]
MHKLIAFTFALVLGTSSAAYADDAADTKARIDALQAQLDAIKAQLEALKAQQQAKPQASAAPAAAPAPAVGLKKGDAVTFLIGGEEVTLYGNLDLSVDTTTKGLAKHYVESGDSPVGNVGYLTGLSTNLSYVGVRGTHKLGKRSGLAYQLETQIDVSSTSGTVNTNSNSDSIVKGGLTSRNSFIGITNPFGSLKLGKTDAPYKTSTARMNPFNSEIGDYAVVMGNTGGDNRVEFGTRLDHSIWYESPNLHGFNLNLLVSPGQNRASDSSNIAAGESSCAGGNVPGSGATPPFCNDGAWASVYSGSATWQTGKAYLVAAYEMHKKVNRTSDLANLDPNDVGDEQAWKGGLQFAPSKATTFSMLYENMARYVPQYLQYQNERTRDGFWLALTQYVNANDNLNFGWARANPTPGDPGQHNTSGGMHPDNMANMYTFAFKHPIDKHTLWYFDWALTVNHHDAHYDLGAGGRGLTTDCHDATQLTAFDPTVTPPVSGTGPHCYAGGHLQGFSSGVDIRF